MEEAATVGGRAGHDVVAGCVVAVVALAGVGAVVLAALPATRTVPDGVRSPATTAAVFVTIEVAVAVTGAVLVRRRTASPIGWLLLGVAVVDGVNRFAEYWWSAALVARPGSLPAGAGLAWIDALTEGLVIVLLALVVLVFPTGRPPRPVRWWWGAGALVLAGGLAAAATRTLRAGPLEGVAYDVANPLGIDAASGALRGVRAVAVTLLVAGVVACVASLVPRWLQGGTTTRRQLAWLATAALGVALVVPVVPLLPDPFTVLYAVAFAALPVAVGLAVLQVRLDVLGVVLHRLAVGLLVVVVLVAAYLAVVAVAQALVGRPGDPFLVVAGAVLVAVAFAPTRRWAGRLVDRLELGPRARPYEVLADLTAEVGHGVPADRAAHHLAEVVGEGVGAARVEVWADGRAPTEPALLAAWPAPGSPGLPPDWSYPVTHEGRDLGQLRLWLAPGRRLARRDGDLLADLAASAGPLLANARLVDELQASRQRLVEAQDAERRRLERDLHDGAQQRLLALAIELGRARTRLDSLDPCEVAGVLDRSAEQVRQAVDELRELARGLHPAVLTSGGLGPALQSLADRSPVPVTVTAELPCRLDPPTEATAYFVVCEALANAARHAQASHIEVSAAAHDGWLRVQVHDDGRGGAVARPGGGLAGLDDRVAAVGGRLSVASTAAGTTVTAEVPCALS